MAHWTMGKEDDGYVRLRLDVCDRSVNILHHEVLEELASVAGKLASMRGTGADAVKGLLLLSGKPGGFVYGADVRQFSLFADEAAIAEHLESVHATLRRIEELPFPTAVGIDGVAVGGGLELALAFDGVFATRSARTQLGFPEVGLGILPGYGGSGRAYRRVGLEAALDLMLTGASVGAEQAHEMGLVDRLVDTADDLPRAMAAWLDERSGVKPERALPAIPDEVEGVITAATRTHLKRSRPDHTPAPFAIIDHLRSHLSDPRAMSDAERVLFPVLLLSPASRGLRRLFDLKDRLRKAGRGESGIERLHVVGAGTMGGDIAAYSALKGLEVTLSDQDAGAVDAALKRAEALMRRRLKSPESVAEALARLQPDLSGEGIRDADLVIEAVAERLEVKQSVFRALEKKIGADAILATNTSSIPLEEIAGALTDPGRLIGIHFFNPMPVLPLVEIIWTDKSRPDLVDRAMRFAGRIGKLPIRCKSSPGFLVNRALLPYVYAGIEAMLDGIEPDRIDQAMTEFGMPMGPIELADQIGLDVTHDAGIPLGIAPAVASLLREHIDAGRLGRKSGRGFYEWDDKAAVRPRAVYPVAELDALAKELLQPMVSECRAAVAEGVVESEDIADAAMIFGVGFPGFRGGPLFWSADSVR